MEENKSKSAKEVNMNNKKPLTLEQIKQIANTLYAENKELKAMLQDRDATLAQLDYLFRVVESTYPFDKEFRDKCATIIVKLMSPVQEKKDESKESK